MTRSRGRCFDRWAFLHGPLQSEVLRSMGDLALAGADAALCLINRGIPWCILSCVEIQISMAN